MNKNNLMFLIVCFGFFLIGCYFLYNSIKFIFKGKRVEGTIIGYITKSHKYKGTRNYTYIPKVQFYTEDNELVAVKYSNSSSSIPQIQKKIYVYYDKNNHRKILIDTLIDKWLFPIVFMSIGLIGMLLILVSYFKCN